MATMKFDVSHSLPKDEAKQRVQKLVDYWGSKYGVTCTWEGEKARVNGKVMGITLDANFEIREGCVVGEGTDPGMLLRGQAKKYIQGKMDTFLDPKKSASELDGLND